MIESNLSFETLVFEISYIIVIHMEGKYIKNIVNAIRPDSVGFDVYVITKKEPKLKKMFFLEKDANNLRHKLRGSIIKTLKDKYGSDEAQYVSADRIADEQKKFFIIKTSDEYDPFSCLKNETNSSALGAFSKDDFNDATGFAFKIRNGSQSLWGYQHLWNIMIPNKSKKNLLAKLISANQTDVFEELASPIISFSDKIDILIIGDSIITSHYKLLQNSFGFQDYIRTRADKVINVIRSKGIVANFNKLTEYVQRGDCNPKYARKMMRIIDSKVLEMDSIELLDNIHKSSRWNGKIKEENGQFVLDTYLQVEQLIDLLDERYTKSEITGIEYDTDVKTLAEQ